MSDSVVVTVPGALAPVCWWPLDGLRPGVSRTITVVVRALARVEECRLGCSLAGWVQAKVTGVFDWTALGAASSGPDLGALAEGAAVTVLLKVTPPALTTSKRKQFRLLFGIGT